jgi:hypothetical protein
METDTLAADVNLEGSRMAYILNPAAYADVKSLAQVSNVSALYDNADKRLNGYFSFITSNLKLWWNCFKNCCFIWRFL